MEEGHGRVDVAVLIPAYNPDEKLLALLPKLKERFRRIVLVNDGSTTGLDVIGKAAPLVEKVLVHERNRGKGAALKTGFAYLGGECDVITADADGQHTPEDIAKVADALARHRGGLVLGVREFSGKVPFRSRFGNFWTRLFFFLMTGLAVRDTQTGLRGIPAGLVKRVAAIPGDRYEYEMAVLADARHHDERPMQVPIATIYLESNATSHFSPLRDSIRIYSSLVQFCLSSVLSFLIDNAVFASVLWFMSAKDTPRRDDILVSLVAARLVSSNFNYFYNRFVVFHAQGRRKRSFFQYWGLVLAIAAASYALTEGLSAAFDVKGVAITAVKIAVETFLFFASYVVQKKFIFKSAERKGDMA